MVRKKLKLALISNDSSRKTTFRKRKMGMMKKVKELSTLCGVNACAIVYSQYDSEPQVWPSTSGVQSVISDFRALPEVEQHKKMVNHETFVRKMLAKALEHVKRKRKENRELEMTEVMFQSLMGKMRMFHLNIMDLNDLGYLIKQSVRDLTHRMNVLENSGTEIGESSNAAAARAPSVGTGTMAFVANTTAPGAMIHEVGSSSLSAADVAFFNPSQDQHHHQQQWFSETMNRAAEQMGHPFMDGNHQNHHHNQPHQQNIQGNSSTTQADVS